MTPKTAENINSLCKKYFTPELCDELVTESKAALKGKIWEQLLKYGDWICNNNFSYQGDADTFCEIILNTVESCWCKYEEKIEEINYSSYFAISVKNNIKNFINSNKGKMTIIKSSLDSPFKSDEKNTLLDTIEDESLSDSNKREKEAAQEYIKKVENYLKAIDAWFKSRKRDDWNKTLITAELYDGLHQYLDYYPEKSLSRFGFIDETIFNLPQQPKNKELAKILDKDEGQLSRAKTNFREQVAVFFNTVQEREV